MHRPLSLAFAAILLAGTSLSAASSSAWAAGPDPKAILTNYADIGQAMYQDAITEADKLKTAVDAFLTNPNDQTLNAARTAWKAARVPYMQSEGFRFGNPEIDDLEGNVNSWPLDEGLIDYVDSSYGTSSDSNPYYTLNVIANPSLKLGDKTVDASKITPELITSLQSAGDNEANVAIGYHAIEFLLWGQDLHGTGPGAGERPATDYNTGAACTHGNCGRRAEYLRSASALLITDLQKMEAVFAADGAGRKRLLADPKAGLVAMFTGLGSLSYGELAGERTKLGLMLHDPEEEHDCFSDNTHNSHYYDQLGMWEIYNGSYKRIDGSEVKGPSLRALMKATDIRVAQRVVDEMQATNAAMTTLKATADSGKMAYDQMIGPDNPEGNKIVQNVVDTLVNQAHAFEAAVGSLGLKITVEGSDSLDNPSAVSQ
jgi:putative iron-regulated protein